MRADDAPEPPVGPVTRAARPRTASISGGPTGTASSTASTPSGAGARTAARRSAAPARPITSFAPSPDTYASSPEEVLSARDAHDGAAVAR